MIRGFTTSLGGKNRNAFIWGMYKQQKIASYATDSSCGALFPCVAWSRSIDACIHTAGLTGAVLVKTLRDCTRYPKPYGICLCGFPKGERLEGESDKRGCFNYRIRIEKETEGVSHVTTKW